MSVDLSSLKKQQSRPASKKEVQPGLVDKLLAFTKKDIKLFKASGDKIKERFFSEVGILLNAGVDLQTVLQLSTESLKKKDKLHGIYEQLLQQITNGSGLAQAMESTKQFNNFDCYSVQIGENTGQLATIFNKLGYYYNKKAAQRRKITGSLSYPFIVLITTVGAIYFMLKFVVPMFSDTLTRFGGELPPLTAFIIRISHHVGQFMLFTMLICATAYIYYKKNKHKVSFQKQLTGIILRIPYLGKIVLKSHMLQFVQAMELLLASKVNIVDSIDLTQKMISFYPIYNSLTHIREELLGGHFFYESMERQRIFGSTMITLVKIGEEVNQLDKIFLQLSKQYESELEYQSNFLMTILEPVMILLLASLVAVILIAMYLPMFKIGTVIH